MQKAGKAVHNPVSTILLWLATSGMGASLFAFANGLENDQVQVQTRQQVIIEQQAEIKADIKDARLQQQVIRDLLIEIKTKVDNQ